MVTTCSYNESMRASACTVTDLETFPAVEQSSTNNPKEEPSATRVFGSETQTTNTNTRPAGTGLVQPSSGGMATTVAPTSTSPQNSFTTGSVFVSETSSPLPNVSSAGGSQGVSKGAVAGIAISTAIIGAAIALFAAFFFLKRRRRSSGHPYRDFTPELGSHVNVKNTPYVQVSQSSSIPPVHATAVTSEKRDVDLANLHNSSDFLAGLLAPAADEQSVRSKVAGLFKRFQDHVDSYYRDVHATMTPSMESDLARFGGDLIEILENSSMPTVAIKHALAGYILSIVSPEAEDQATLFPAEIAGLKANERSSDAGTSSTTYFSLDMLTRAQKTKLYTSSTNVLPSISTPPLPPPFNPGNPTSAKPLNTSHSHSSPGRTPHTTSKRRMKSWCRS
jgi:hypothetical protein